ncbi:BNR-4 repeat-containing protein [Paenibacillus sp. WC2504]|uniref:BNR-4 repeat-containing protein n=1 Tax=Paenibacillus sp. WC2504 TaxID=3461403 RepID=UPI0040459149
MNSPLSLTQEFTSDGAWCFFADPRALYYQGQHHRTYVGWLNSTGDVWIGCYDHLLGAYDTFLIRSDLQQDDHANPSLYIDESGHITIFYSAHNGSKMYYRTTRLPEDLSSFGAEMQLPANTDGHFGYTYPTPIYLSAEKRLYLFWRGGNFKPNFSVSSDLNQGEWSPVRTLIMDSGQRPYIRYASNGKDTIHFSCTDGHPNIEPYNSIYYARYREGAIYRADGSLIKQSVDLPLELTEIDRVFDGTSAQRNAWIWDVAEDEQGYPVIVYAVFESLEDHRYYYSRWDGAHWVTNEITAAGRWFPQTPESVTETEPYYSGGIILDHSDPSIVYVSRQVQGTFEIERWSTSNLGVTWSSAAITANSTSHQVRPFLTRGSHDGQAILFWMSGDYIHYTNYNTSIRSLIPTSS